MLVKTSVITTYSTDGESESVKNKNKPSSSSRLEWQPCLWKTGPLDFGIQSLASGALARPRNLPQLLFQAAANPKEFLCRVNL